MKTNPQSVYMGSLPPSVPHTRRARSLSLVSTDVRPDGDVSLVCAEVHSRNEEELACVVCGADQTCAHVSCFGLFGTIDISSSSSLR